MKSTERIERIYGTTRKTGGNETLLVGHEIGWKDNKSEIGRKIEIQYAEKSG